MKKIYSVLLLTVMTVCMKATSYTVTINGFTYSPATLSVLVGDVVTIQANGTHPLAEVTQSTWNANQNTPSGTGFGTKTTNYTFTVTTASDIYYVCTAHAGMGMKGMITVSSTSINEQDASISSVSIFPNPAKDKFSVKYNSEDSNVILKLYSICGQEVESLVFKKETIAGVSTINVDLQNKVPAGVYFLQLTSNAKKVTRKIIID
ncbi:MAG: T9SS type A sorting domain-containing protein [Bacteroidota bacterium]